MILSEFYETVIFYMPVIAGAFAQFLSFIFRANFLNWEDDLINVLTYIGFHVLITSFVFIFIPLCSDNIVIPATVSGCAMIVFIFVAVFRAIQIIPLERSIIFRILLTPNEGLNFDEHNDSVRLLALGSVPFDNPYNELRYRKLREKLARKNPEKKG